MHPICIVTKSGINLELAQRCIASCLSQDVPTMVHVYDNSETGAGESAWLDKHGPQVVNHSAGVDLGVSAAWNFLLHAMFEEWQAQHVLVVNDDTVLPRHFMLGLLGYSEPFVTGHEINDLTRVDDWSHLIDPLSLVESPDFSAFLIRRHAWDTVGEFDETMALYGSDADYHVRAHQLGLPLWKSTRVPFYHERSSTLRRATLREHLAINARADADRARFKQKWGCGPNDPEYSRLFDPKP